MIDKKRKNPDKIVDSYGNPVRIGDRVIILEQSFEGSKGNIISLNDDGDTQIEVKIEHSSGDVWLKETQLRLIYKIPKDTLEAFDWLIKELQNEKNKTI